MGGHGIDPRCRIVRSIRSSSPRQSNESDSRGQLSIDYDRYARFDSSAEIVITVKPEGQGDGPTRLWFDAAYLDSLRVITVSPLPLPGAAREGERAFVFQTNGYPFTAVLAVQFQTVGIVHGHAKVNEQEALLLTHLVWP